MLQAALSFLLLPLYTSEWSAAEFGIFQMVALASSLAGALFYLGAYSSLSRYYFDPEPGEPRRRVAGTAVIVTLIGAVLQMVAVAIAARPLSRALLGAPDYATFLIVGFAGTATTFVNQIFLLLMRLSRRSTAVVVTNLVALLVTAGAILFLVLERHWGIMGALAGALAGQLAVMPAAIWLVRGDIRWEVDRAQLRSQLAFGLPAVVIGVGYYALDQADRYVLSRAGTMADVGVYSLGYRIGMVVQLLFVQPFAQIWNPMRLEHRDHAEAPRFFATVLTYYTMIGLVLVTALSLFAPEIIGLVGRRDEYAGASRVVPIVLFSHLIYGSVNVIDTGILVRNRLRYYVGLLWAALLLNLALNWWWVPRGGYMGSAWATLVSYAVLVTAVFAVSNRLMPVATEPLRLTGLIASAVAVILIGSALPFTGAVAIAMKVALFVVLLGGWLAFVLEPEERRWLRNGLQRIGIGGGLKA